MEERTEPAWHSGHQLTMEAIWLTFQRLRNCRRAGVGSAAAPAETASRLERALPPASNDPLDAAIDTDPVGLARALGSSVEPEGGAVLPNPVITDRNLSHYLGRASGHQGTPRATSRPSRWWSAVAARLLPDHQIRYNRAVVDTLHQLDHRTRGQSETIASLEAQLAETRRALAALEATGSTRS